MNERKNETVLELMLKNHSGAMMHVCSLFARRVFNVDGILCVPAGDGSRSRLWLRVRNDARLHQMMKQLEKLEDVLSVRRAGPSSKAFTNVEERFIE